MKTLTLVRHAKSSWDDTELADFDRPLNRRGERDAPEMARRLAATGDPPDRIVSSPALRALQTARVLAPALGIDPASLVTESRVYEASYSRLVAAKYARELNQLPREVLPLGAEKKLTTRSMEALTSGQIEFRLVKRRKLNE